MLLEVRENPTVVPKRFGHTTFTTTMDIYSHVTPTMQRSRVDRFAAGGRCVIISISQVPSTQPEASGLARWNIAARAFPSIGCWEAFSPRPAARSLGTR